MLVKPGTKVSLKDIDPGDTGEFHSSEDAAERLEHYQSELATLQRLLYAENRRAVLIVLQGMDTSGKDGTIRSVMSGLTPLGVQVTSFKAPHEEERAHDYLWRVHHAVPMRGSFGLFNRSHYEDVLIVRVHDLVPEPVWKKRYAQINDFEKMLVENDVIVLKFFLHISKGEQKRRLEERLSDPTRFWKFSLDDIKERKFWKQYRKAYEVALSRCSTRLAPWHIIPADQKWYRNVLIAKVIVEALRELDMQYPPAAMDLSKVVIE